MPTKIYSYFARIDRSPQREQIERQFSLAHRYYNRCIELVRQRWERYAEIRRSHSQKLVAIEAEIVQVEAALADALARLQSSKVTRRSKVGGDDERAEVVRVKEQLRGLRDSHKAERVRLKESGELSEAVEAMDEEFNERYKRDVYGADEFAELHWGTKNTTKAAVDDAQKKSKNGPPKFKRWDRSGRIFCQIQSNQSRPPLSVDRIYDGSDPRVKVERRKCADGSLHRKHAVVTVKFVCCEQGKSAAAEVHAVLHRPLPENGVVVGVQLIRRPGPWYRNATGEYENRDDHSIQFVVRTPDEEVAAVPETMVGIDVGWRLRDDGGLRVACWKGSDGGKGELVIPKAVWHRWGHASQIQGQRDVHFDSVRSTLSEWLNLHSHPEWLKESTSHIGQWRSINRLLAVVAAWERFEGDEAIYEALTTWRDQDQHLDQWVRGDKTKADRQRDYQYRVFARTLANRYGYVAVENLNLAALRTDPEPESDKETSRRLKKNRNAAAAGTLVQYLAEAFSDRMFKVPPAGTTKTCHVCNKHAGKWDSPADLRHTCASCGAEWDRDENAAHNILARGERLRAAKNAVAARGVEGDDGKDDVAGIIKTASRWTKRIAA